jgi:hypothetical protein
MEYMKCILPAMATIGEVGLLLSLIIPTLMRLMGAVFARHINCMLFSHLPAIPERTQRGVFMFRQKVYSWVLRDYRAIGTKSIMFTRGGAFGKAIDETFSRIF